MAVGSDPLPELRPVAGVRLASAAAGVRKPDRRDLVLIELAAGSTCAAVFTTNRLRAAPVQVAVEHLRGEAVRYLLINTGIANAATGRDGLIDARTCCEALAEQTVCRAEAVLPFSTGVIGEPLPVDRIRAALPALVDDLQPEAWVQAADGIRTTDTRPKGASETASIGGRPVTLTGIAKGAGMIRPDMATMLAFIATDAAVPEPLARRALAEAVGQSFNRITIDGDTSTNDACALIATGQSGVAVERVGTPSYAAFVAALTRMSQRLAQAIVRDGEGATRFVTITAAGAASEAEAERVAFTVAESPLVKTALFAGDPNWGRVLAAVGRAGLSDLAIDGVRIWLDDYLIAEAGGRAAHYREAEAAARMAGEDVALHIDLGRGGSEATVWTCDLSCEYVRINADYRS